MRVPAATVVLLCACAAEPQPGPAVRLVSTASDTVVVNSRYPVTLPVHALDAAGRTVAAGPLNFTWAGGDSLPITPTGAVTCTRSGDFAVRATLDRVALRLVVQCRLVEYVRMPGPLQFVLGDSALSQPFSIRFVAYDAAARPVLPAVAGMSVGDTTIVSLRGVVLSPRRRGITWANARIGERDGQAGVHVYQRVDSLAALDTLLRVPDVQRLFAVPLRLGPGEARRQRLPAGQWMLVMLPEADTAPDRIHLRVEGARCEENFLNSPRRWGCYVRPGANATVMLYRPFGAGTSSRATEYLLVRWLFG